MALPERPRQVHTEFLGKIEEAARHRAPAYAVRRIGTSGPCVSRTDWRLHSAVRHEEAGPVNLPSELCICDCRLGCCRPTRLLWPLQCAPPRHAKPNDEPRENWAVNRLSNGWAVWPRTSCRFVSPRRSNGKPAPRPNSSSACRGLISRR
jgi:hypothetical protein